jgi:hypothetical protein
MICRLQIALVLGDFISGIKVPKRPLKGQTPAFVQLQVLLLSSFAVLFSVICCMLVRSALTTFHTVGVNDFA